jgi:ABC-type uncharacterized transport system substrate-binding protein
MHFCGNQDTQTYKKTGQAFNIDDQSHTNYETNENQLSYLFPPLSSSVSNHRSISLEMKKYDDPRTYFTRFQNKNKSSLSLCGKILALWEPSGVNSLIWKQVGQFFF